MSILNDLAKKLLGFLDINNKQEELDNITNYPDTPRLNGSLRELLPEIGKRSGLIIPATELSIEDESYSTFSERLEKETYPKYKRQAEDDYFTFSSERRKIIKNGFIYVSAERIKYKLVELSACIKDGGRGDEDGFGVEPDTYVKGYLSLDGEILSPIALEESNTNTNIKNWLALDINPVDSSGKIKIFPYDEVEKEYRLPGYFEVKKGENVGLIDKELNLIIPITYKMIHGDENGLVWVRLHNDLCGIVDLKNNIKIPPIYNYLSYIDKGEYKGLYVTELNGMHGLINQENQIILPFKEIDIKSFYELIKD
jgi:hypothetical protein